jgi:hypothetical protein
MVSTSSVVKNISYEESKISYNTYDAKSTEKFRLTKKPAQIMAGGVPLQEMTSSAADGYVWTPLAKGGILQITKSNREIEIQF